MHVCAHKGMCVQVKEHMEVGSLLPACGPCRSNSDPQTWQEPPLMEPPRWLLPPLPASLPLHPVYLSLYLSRVSLRSPVAHYVDKDGLKYTDIYLPLPSKGWDDRMCHHAWPPSGFIGHTGFGVNNQSFQKFFMFL